jgi:hypothetical protein
MPHDIRVEVLSERDPEDAMEMKGRKARNRRNVLERKALVEPSAHVHARTSEAALHRWPFHEFHPSSLADRPRARSADLAVDRGALRSLRSIRS